MLPVRPSSSEEAGSTPSSQISITEGFPSFAAEGASTGWGEKISACSKSSCAKVCSVSTSVRTSLNRSSAMYPCRAVLCVSERFTTASIVCSETAVMDSCCCTLVSCTMFERLFWCHTVTAAYTPASSRMNTSTRLKIFDCRPPSLIPLIVFMFRSFYRPGRFPDASFLSRVKGITFSPSAQDKNRPIFHCPCIPLFVSSQRIAGPAEKYLRNRPLQRFSLLSAGNGCKTPYFMQYR